MEVLLFGLIVLMLLVFGYMQLQKNVVKMPGELTSNDEEIEEAS
jgi:hypothetical protein